MQRTRFFNILIVAIGLTALLVSTACTAPFGGDGQVEANVSERPAPTGDEPRGTVLSEQRPAPNFELIDQTGQSLRLSDLRGNAVALFFGYTRCPDICPLTLSFMATAAAELGDEADDVSFLFITVDPEQDTPDRLAEYLERVDVPVIGLSGSRDAVESVWNDYDIAVERHEREDGNYLIDHSAHIWLVDAAGDLVMFAPMGADGNDLANDLRWLLGKGA